jgi:hypothetical protein
LILCSGQQRLMTPVRKYSCVFPLPRTGARAWLPPIPDRPVLLTRRGIRVSHCPAAHASVSRGVRGEAESAAECTIGSRQHHCSGMRIHSAPGPGLLESVHEGVPERDLVGH